jgi:hypothetical protein
MDELFLLPSAPVAMPRAYWEDEYFLTSLLLVIEPSEAEWKRVEYAMEHHEVNDYDMDILNKEDGQSAIVIPRQQVRKVGPKEDTRGGKVHPFLRLAITETLVDAGSCGHDLGGQPAEV